MMSSTDYCSAYELLKKEEASGGRRIMTFCQGLDALLGGGVKVGGITEIVGLPGVGKSTFCLQLCIDVQIPKCLRGVDGDALFIDTGLSFSITRLREMCQEFVKHLHLLLNQNSNLANFSVPSVEDVMSRIHVARCSDVEELLQKIMGLDAILALNKNVKLIVVDSIAFPFYTEDANFYTRTKVLYEISQVLFRVASEYNIAVVITNNMTTKIIDSSDSGQLVPSLGNAWGHIPNHRLKFSVVPESGQRIVEILKSHNAPFGQTGYRILSAGFRD